MNKTFSCDLCKCKKREVLYRPEGSLRKTQISICTHCGLVASEYSQKISKRLISTSSAANWGNIRHGKGLRFNAHKDLLAKQVSFSEVTSILDIGSNRGDFVLWIKRSWPKIHLTAVEPDKHVVNLYRTSVNKLILDRFEHILFQKNQAYDFIYCSHTLEHSDSATFMLQGIWNLLKPDGQVFIEVPNIEIIGKKDIVEEYFIDKHAFHFSPDALIQLLKTIGFSIEKQIVDQYNIAIFAKKAKPVAQTLEAQRNKLVVSQKKLIRIYASNLENNRKRLRLVSSKLNELAKRQRVAYWGGGRIFDALVTYGKLDTTSIIGVIDTYLAKYLDSVHGVPMKLPTALRLLQPDVVVILAQSSTEEIEAGTRSFGIRHVIRFADVFQVAK